MSQKTKIIKAWAVMNDDERNGFDGILWFGEGDKGLGIIPLMIFSGEQQAIKMASRKEFYKAVPCEIKINLSSK